MIEFIDGDVTQPEEYGIDSYVLCHCVNTDGIYGGGVSGAIHKRWPKNTEQYLKHIGYAEDEKFDPLGTVAWYKHSKGVWIANLVGQKGTISPDNPKPIQYKEFEEGLTWVAKFAIKETEGNLVMPHFIGSRLAGGDWKKVLGIVEKIDESLKTLNVFFFKLGD